MNTRNYKIRKKHQALAMVLVLAVMAFSVSCSEEDPFVDRTPSPVLLVFDDVQGYLAAGGLTSIPSVSRNVTNLNYTTPITLSLTVYELDKTGILDHKVGIDSLPVAGLQIIFSKRDGSAPVTIVSDDSGKVVVSTTWEALGITDVQTIATGTAARSITIPLLWTGSYKGQSFARYSQLVFNKPAS